MRGAREGRSGGPNDGARAPGTGTLSGAPVGAARPGGGSPRGHGSSTAAGADASGTGADGRPTGLALPVALAPAVAAAIAAAVAAALLAVPASLSAQEGGDGSAASIRWGGLLRTGLRIGPADLGRQDGFELYDARLRAEGEIGIVFDYFVQGEFDDRTDELRLLDARLSVPIVPPVAVEIGQFKAPFGAEALKGKGDVTFVERSQATQILAPGRQVGVQLAGEALDGRLSYAGGIFNGNGPTLENDDGRFLYAAHVAYNTLGTARFYDELMVEVGASVAFSRDSAAALAGLADVPAASLGVGSARIDPASYRGDRFLWGVDLEAGFRGFFLRGEYLRGEFEPEEPAPPPSPFLPSPGEEDAEGLYLEGGYNFLGAIEGVLRWDAMDGFLRSVDGRSANETPGAGTDFLVFGLNLFPGLETKVGFQYAVGLAGARRGPGLADGEFALTAQVDF